ncbi:hypothetical protein B0T24DRAFT_636040 [Lasiosphaeria ovina]|uniref:Uncharacterized protein n=1 Tax=Lasiosphaeria ovina TaxID=92902 RepID=A0AAE0N117_9PEZI|nr:hypothetical protein B0T24DRAFT_636040 [Lasiosphaeria ovina]
MPGQAGSRRKACMHGNGMHASFPWLRDALAVLCCALSMSVCLPGWLAVNELRSLLRRISLLSRPDSSTLASALLCPLERGSGLRRWGIPLNCFRVLLRRSFQLLFIGRPLGPLLLGTFAFLHYFGSDCIMHLVLVSD